MRSEDASVTHALPPKQPGEYRIAHLSDLHLCAAKTPISMRIKRLVYHSRPEGLDLLASLLDDLAAAEVDHVIITGDLTESAALPEYEDAATLLAPLCQSDMLSVIPGNHDVCYARRQRPAAHTTRVPRKLWRFTEYFGQALPDAYPPDMAIEKTCIFPFVKFVGDDKIALIGVDTTSRVPRRALPLNALGTMGKRQFRDLQRILTSPALREKTKVVLMHHHLLLLPVNHLGDSIRGMRKSRRLLELFYSARVDLVLHGHKHHPFCWHSHTFKRHDLAIICAGPPNATWMDATRIEDTLVYNVYSFKDASIQIHYRECGYRPRQNVRAIRHGG
ncbi:MAG: metallophosphoesterase [Planctomycetes bacterium]|nr:metallophosphoesterase [Planctomycetota bacterium]